MIILTKFEIQFCFIHMELDFNDLCRHFELKLVSFIDNIGDRCIKILAFFGIKSDCEVPNLWIRDDPDSLKGIVFEFTVSNI